MTAADIFLTPIYLFFIVLFARSYVRRKHANDEFAKYFMPAFWIKTIGCLCFVSIYMFYYKGGDTLSYYQAANTAYKILFLIPGDTISFLFSSSDTVPLSIKHNSPVGYIWHGISSMTTIRITTFFCIFSFGSFVVTSLLFSTISFFAIWRLYVLFCSIYPSLIKELSYSILFIPSIIFWGSGILKDTITLFCVCWMVVAFYEGFIRKNNRMLNIAILLICGYYVSLIKGYILFTLLPNVILLYVLSFQARIRSGFLRSISTPFYVGIGVVLFLLFLNFFGESMSTYSLGSIEKKASDFEMWHRYLYETQGGSGYYLGEQDFTFPGVLLYVPQAINVTLFRPYFWEVDNAVQFLSSIESLILFIFTLSIILSSKIFHIGKFPFRDPFLLFCFSFSIILALAVGATSYNFGALVRYKIPCLPFYISGVVILRAYLRSYSAAPRRLANSPV